MQQRNQGLDRHTGFEPSEGRTEAEVDFEAEAEMLARIVMKIEVIEILELAFISIGGTGHDHEVAALRNSRISDQARSRQKVQAAFSHGPIRRYSVHLEPVTQSGEGFLRTFETFLDRQC